MRGKARPATHGNRTQRQVLIVRLQAVHQRGVRVIASTQRCKPKSVPPPRHAYSAS